MDALNAIARALGLSAAELIGQGVDQSTLDPRDLLLAEDMPRSLTRFSRSERFVSVVKRLADGQGIAADDMRRQVLIAMASAPRRSTGEPIEEDWRRLLDVFYLILS